MRWLVVIVPCYLACFDEGSGRRPQPDAASDAPADSSGEVCYPSGACATGLPCGTGCCQSGERCVDGTCMCGANPACAEGDSCVSGGPVLPTHGCGVLCCGPSTGGCPI